MDRALTRSRDLASVPSCTIRGEDFKQNDDVAGAERYALRTDVKEHQTQGQAGTARSMHVAMRHSHSSQKTLNTRMRTRALCSQAGRRVSQNRRP